MIRIIEPITKSQDDSGLDCASAGTIDVIKTQTKTIAIIT